MDRKKYFANHYNKLRFEAWLNSFIIALIVGLFAGGASAIVTWFLPFNGLLLSVGVAFAFTAMFTVLFYFTIYRPDVIKNARRLDRLGLEERLVTMVEYENDDSYMAAVQREDAAVTLSLLTMIPIHLTLSVLTTSLLIASTVFFIVPNTFEILDVAGVLPGGDDLFEEEEEEEFIDYVSVTYECEGGGFIDGEEVQLIPKGTSSAEIWATADEGWEFLEWEDGYKKPYRSDKNITEDTVFIAIFAQTGDDSDSDQSDPNADPTDKPNDKPQQSEQKQDQEQESEDENESENESDNQPKPDEPDKPSDNAGSKYEEANQVIDGNTYYKDALEGNTEDGISYYEKLRERLEKEGGTLTEEERYIIEKYLGIV